MLCEFYPNYKNKNGMQCYKERKDRDLKANVVEPCPPAEGNTYIISLLAHITCLLFVKS